MRGRLQHRENVCVQDDDLECSFLSDKLSDFYPCDSDDVFGSEESVENTISDSQMSDVNVDYIDYCMKAPTADNTPGVSMLNHRLDNLALDLTTTPPYLTILDKTKDDFTIETNYLTPEKEAMLAELERELLGDLDDGF